jgi:hypothetical protein
MCQSPAAIRCTLVQGFEMTLDRRGDNTWSSILQSPETPPTPLLTLIFLSSLSLSFWTREMFLEREKAYMLVAVFPASTTKVIFSKRRNVSVENRIFIPQKIHENFPEKKIKIWQF